MNYNEMTAAQCADWLAAKDGWVWRPYAGADDQRLWTHPDGREELEYRGAERLDNEHGPYKLTLDGAAGALPAKMFFYVNYCILFGEETYVVCAVTKGTRIKEFRSEGHDELTARYRAAVAARMEEET